MGLLCGSHRNAARASSMVPLRSAEAHHRHTWTFPQQSNCAQDVRRRRDGTALLTGAPSLLKASTHSLCLSTTTSSQMSSEDSSRGDAATGNQVCVWVLVPKACPRTFVHYIYAEELGPPRPSFLLSPTVLQSIYLQ